MDPANEPIVEEPSGPERRPSLEGLIVAGSYRVSSLIASGGMGDVYQAEHVRLGNPVAVKFMRAGARDDARSVQRFHHEARRIAAVRSENIVRVFDYGELPDGSPYLVMERLFGEDLRALLLREGPLPVRRAVKLLMDACRGLSIVHGAGLVHRDLKPANLFVERASSSVETCKILDFGVVKALASEATHQGALLGTVRYMAPEQLENAASAKASADVYALGAILYESLTGVPVHSAETLQETMFAILHRDPRPPSELRAMPAELEATILRSLSRDASARFVTTTELAHALAPFGVARHEPGLLEAVDEDTFSDGASALVERKGRWLSATRSSQVLVLVSLAFGVGAGCGWLARGGLRAVPRASPGPARVIAPTQTMLAAPSVSSPAASLQPISAAVSAPVPSFAATSVRPPPAPNASRKVQRGHPAAPRGTNRSTPIAGRFDPSDPYE